LLSKTFSSFKDSINQVAQDKVYNWGRVEEDKKEQLSVLLDLKLLTLK